MCKIRLVSNCFVLNKLEINVLVVGFLPSILGFYGDCSSNNCILGEHVLFLKGY